MGHLNSIYQVFFSVRIGKNPRSREANADAIDRQLNDAFLLFVLCAMALRFGKVGEAADVQTLTEAVKQ